MMNQVKLWVLFLMIVFCSCCIAQNKGESSSYGPTTSVRIIRQDRNGNIWLASNEGIIRYDGKNFTNITGELGLNRFFSVLEDSKGNFWFGNNGTGAYYYDSVKKSVQHFTTQDGLISNQVMCMYEDRTGTVWFGTRGGVSSYNPRRLLGQSFKNLTNEGGFPNNDVTTIMEDRKGTIWFVTRGNAYTYDGKIRTVFTSKDNKTFSDVWSIIEDKKGNIWLGGGDGLWRYDGRTCTNFTHNFVNYVYEDKKGNIWTSGKNANGIWVLCYYITKPSANQNPMVIEIPQSLNLFGILEASDGSIWFGSFDGVYRYYPRRAVGNTITSFKK